MALLSELSPTELETGIIQSNPNLPTGLLEIADSNPRHLLENTVTETDLRRLRKSLTRVSSR